MKKISWMSKGFKRVKSYPLQYKQNWNKNGTALEQNQNRSRKET